MNASTTWQVIHRTTLGAVLVCTTACVESVRVPLAVPLPSVGGARPATPGGVELIAEFGDKVWGQEQERAEMGGGGLAVALGDRVELSTLLYGKTRQVNDSNGGPHHGEVTTSIRGKIRLGDFAGGLGAFGIQLARSGTRRERTDVQDERLSASDFALPVEFHALTSGPFIDQRLTVYAAPRLVLQSFEDRLNRRRDITDGTLAGALAGVAARLRYFTSIAEMNFVRTPTMEFSGTTFDSGWHVLPMASVRGLIPIGE